MTIPTIPEAWDLDAWYAGLDVPGDRYVELFGLVSVCLEDDLYDAICETGSIGDFANLVVGLYWFLAHNHGGQYSDMYSALCTIAAGYHPGCSAEEPPDNVADLVDLFDNPRESELMTDLVYVWLGGTDGE